MENPMRETLRRSLIVGIIVLFFSTTYLPVLAKEDKPDLTITGLIFMNYEDNPMDPTYAMAYVKNIGDVGVDSYQISYSVCRMVLKNTVDSDDIQGHGIASGERDYPRLVDDWNLPSFGFFKFTCNITSDYEESNYDNNLRVFNCIALCGIWKVV